MRASVKTACREETCLVFALSQAQRVCNCVPQNVSLNNLYRNYGHKLRVFMGGRHRQKYENTERHRVDRNGSMVYHEME